MIDPRHSELPDSHTGLPDAEDQAEKLMGPLADDMHEYAIFGLDADGRVSSWNAGAERMKGYRSDEIIGSHFSRFYPAEQVEASYPEWELSQAAASGFFIDHGWRIRKDGSWFWAHVVITAQRAPDGSLDGFIKVVRDDTEVRARQERSERRFSDLLAVAPVPIALLDEAGRVLDANAALSDMLRCRKQELYGKFSTDLLHPNDRAGGFVPRPTQASIVAANKSPLPHRQLARSDGRAVLCEVRCEASVQDDGTLFWLAVFQDITEQVQRAETLHYQATHDDSTGLLNRKGAKDLLTEFLASSSREKVGVLFSDLDNFNRVNGALGHEGGDELLMALAQRLRAELPPTCTAARPYGDEFVVLCPDITSCGGIEVLTSKVSDALNTTVPIRDQLIKVSASTGTAMPEGSDATSEELLRLAGAAMFEAKSKGHGFSAHARAALSKTVADQLTLEEELRQAIRHDQLTLHYQPVVDADRSVVVAEALVRWPHPERGMLAPDVVLSVAGQGGLEIELDRWVLRTALREAAGWPRCGNRPVGIAVNLAGLQPTIPHFSEDVCSALSDSGIDPSRVVLEVVETALVDLSSQPRKTMSELSATGLRFAMDDFGTGYSSLARLKDLPTQIIKLDRRFVSGMGLDPSDLGIGRAVVELARSMGRTCIAEGVETAAQYRLLHGLGVDAYQGYLFSPPVPAEDFRELLARSPLPLHED